MSNRRAKITIYFVKPYFTDQKTRVNTLSDEKYITYNDDELQSPENQIVPVIASTQ
jgi:hypothetical protein